MGHEHVHLRLWQSIVQCWPPEEMFYPVICVAFIYSWEDSFLVFKAHSCYVANLLLYSALINAHLILHLKDVASV